MRLSRNMLNSLWAKSLVPRLAADEEEEEVADVLVPLPIDSDARQGADDEADMSVLLDTVLPAVKVSLVERYRSIIQDGAGTDTAVPRYESYVHSDAFDKRLLQEIRLQGGVPGVANSSDYVTVAGFLHEYLISLIDRKEIDLGGMVANSRVPDGFARGRGSMAGNNCFISSVVQALLGESLYGPEHNKVCAKIREAGIRRDLWQEADFIEANPATLAFVTLSVLGKGHAVVCRCYSSHDGTTVTNVCCDDGSTPEGQKHVIHVFNPTGVHFDPLWERQ